ncbi:MAG: DUF4150 domain-containing protein [Deltaproteobacteria bacterium]|nr:DUF4150 domain-containing protein [Deltaproteobacteria bacterium]
MAFPDVCKVPSAAYAFVPVPFPNISMVMQAPGTAGKVKICGRTRSPSRAASAAPRATRLDALRA